MANNAMGGFMEFLKKYGVVGLAIGIVAGGAVTKLVDSLVATMINPIVAVFMGEDGLTGGLQLVEDKPDTVLQFGSFATALINFLILMFVVYMLVNFFVGRFMSDDEKDSI